jgi:cathepsin B
VTGVLTDSCLQYKCARVKEGGPTPPCPDTCDDGVKVLADSTRYTTSKPVLYRSKEEMQLDILTNGPIVASIMIYYDLMFYRTGVYRNTSVNPIGGHGGKQSVSALKLVRVIGWGVEESSKELYWLITNSWGYS